LSPESGLAKFYRKIELETLRKTDAAIFVSFAMQKYYEELNVKTSDSIIIPCAVNRDQILGADIRKKIRQKLGLDEKLVFIYVGSAVHYQQVDKMCELFAVIHQKYPKAFFLILSHHVTAFQAKLQQAGISPEIFHIESVSHGDVFEYLQAADIGFLLRNDSPVNRVSSPTKFGEYCSCGVPIITTACVGDVSQLVLSQHLGCVIDLEKFSGDERLFAFLDDVLKNRADYFSHCVEFVREHYSWQKYGDMLSNLYFQLGQRI
jgi:glycosyltransferase involved in cell wall biosynthesis